MEKKIKLDADDLKESPENYQRKTSDQFKDFVKDGWPDIKDHMTGEGQQTGDYLEKNGGKAYQSSVKALKKDVRGLDQWVNGTNIHKDDK